MDRTVRAFLATPTRHTAHYRSPDKNAIQDRRLNTHCAHLATRHRAERQPATLPINNHALPMRLPATPAGVPRRRDGLPYRAWRHRTCAAALVRICLGSCWQPGGDLRTTVLALSFCVYHHRLTRWTRMTSCLPYTFYGCNLVTNNTHCSSVPPALFASLNAAFLSAYRPNAMRTVRDNERTHVCRLADEPRFVTVAAPTVFSSVPSRGLCICCGCGSS